MAGKFQSSTNTALELHMVSGVRTWTGQMTARFYIRIPYFSICFLPDVAKSLPKYGRAICANFASITTSRPIR